MTVVLGIGTGRCGTTSLATLLNAQQGAKVTHERYDSRVPWGRGGRRWLKHLLHDIDCGTKLYGDVSFYWLPHIEFILEEISRNYNVKVIVLKRDKKDTVSSFINKTISRNHWQIHEGEKYNHCHQGWDNCFPKFCASGKREALEAYWKYYYGEVSRLSQKYEKNVRCFRMKSLNRKNGQKDILKYAGVEACNRVLLENIKKNKNPYAGIYGKIQLLKRNSKYYVSRIKKVAKDLYV
jgi:hypothetical protein